MPVDDHDDERSSQSSLETLEVEENGPAPQTPRVTEAPTGGEPPAAPAAARRRRWRRHINRRNAMWTGIAAVAAIILLVFVAFILYRSGQVDRLIANQIVRTLAQYGVRAEIGSFETKFTPRTAELRDIKLYDAQTGEMIGKVDRILATVRIEDLYALNLRRNVNLESLEIDGLETWVKFDEQERSNFRNLRLPPPDPNRRILFSYSTARVKLNGAVIHYDDERHDISGEARNVRATIQPDDPAAPAESWMNTVELALSDSTFVYDGRPVNQIDIEARGRINQTRAEIQELILRSPIAEARLQGTMDDWRALRYQLQITSTVDLTQTSDVLQTETSLRGVGQFTGTVSGEGTRYRVDGQIRSDALAAGGVRLKALAVNAVGTGDGENYEAQGRAVAELLTAGDFQLNAVQLAGGVMGAGTDFRWVGELRTASLRNGGLTISGLIFSDATAEFRDGRIDASSSRGAASGLAAPGVDIRGLQVSGVRYARSEKGANEISAPSLSGGTLSASGAVLNNVAAANVRVGIPAEGATSVTADRLQVGGLRAADVQTGSLNIAGVRLSISDGRVEGSSGDINVSTVALGKDGRAENVRLARPVFTVEPSGRYRASADLSLGGGVLGQLKLGAARGAVVATNNQVQLNDFTAELFNGRARGSATVSTSGGGQSSVSASFENLDIAGLIAAQTGRVVPLAGAATGAVDLRFPGTNFKAASGRLSAQFSGETGNETSGRTPLTGELALQAERGLFQIERASLQTGATRLEARGRFSFENDSDLQVNLASTDAAELQRVVISSGFLPELEQKLKDFGIELAGKLDFNGTVRGSLDDPLVNGRASVDSLLVKGREVGSLSGSIESTPAEVRIVDGQLTERDGGGARFTATIPRQGENNITLSATLDRADAGNLVALLPISSEDLNTEALAGLGSASGRVEVAGLPGAMNGRADLRIGPGRIADEPFEEMVARATFNGSKVSVENLDARFRAGHIGASGSYDIESKVFDFRARGDNVRLDVLAVLIGGGGRLPQLSGVADFTANASGDLDDPSSYRVDLDAQGRDVTVNGQPAGILTLKGRTTADQKFNVELTTGIFGQPQMITAQIDLSDSELPTTFETTLTNTNLTQLFKALLPDANVAVTGRATGVLRASGNLLGEEGFSALSGRAEFSELVVQIEDVPLTAESPLIVQFSPREIVFEKTRFTGPGTNILFGGTAALGEGGRQDLSINGELNLRVLNNLSPDTFLSGTARVGVRVNGTFADPRLTGTAEVAGASFSRLISNQRLTVSNINGRLRFNADQVLIDSLTGRLGGGTVTVTGGALLAGLSPSQFRLSVRGDDVTVPFPDDFRSTADANLEIAGSLETQLVVIRGLVNLRRAEYTENIDLGDLINRRREASITEGAGGPAFGAVTTQLDLQVEGRDALVVRNNLADVVGSVSLQIRGSVEEPLISGRITASRGTLNFRNDRYELTRAFIDLPPRRDADPLLNIQAESEIRGYRVIVSLTGPLSQPQAIVRSDPALPQTDVVSLITTGNLSSGDQSASTLAQSGFGTATSLLTETLINAPVQRATDKLFGLNRFEIDPLIVGRGGASPTARLTVGRQINRNLSITYSTNVTTDPNQVVALEYRLSDRLSFVAQYQQGPVNSLRAENNNFSFEIRFRKRF